MTAPPATVRLAPEEKAELMRLAAEQGTTLSQAMRRGAWLYLAGADGLSHARTYKRGPKKKEEAKKE